MGKERKIKTNGRISKIGSYAIASSMPMRDHRQQPSITCTTFNILAPMYKRINLGRNQNSRESDCRVYWLARSNRILDSLLRERSCIICLQEFWLGNEELVSMYEKRLGDAGYVNFQLGRTNNRGDGLLTAVRKDYFRVINYRELLFNDCGDRVAQLLHVELASPFSQFLNNNDICLEILIVSTHLLFPHDSSLCLVRLHQVYKILQYLEFVSERMQAQPNADYTLRYLLRRASLTEEDAFAFLKADINGDCITYYGFCEALRQLNLTGRCHGLSVEETKDLWVQADVDGNGLDYKEFQHRIWNPESAEQNDQINNEDQNGFPEDGQEQAIGLRVESAVLFPPEVEKGRWPENYFLSDHARLTVVFSPITMPC
ncbi:hypothetical protein MANES_01G044801v8 [Manihot esculenta]|uniref:Uncharacterized protein n=1 Tax=Manihot esculenta TaxID=3983 RepID=A0ACB7I9V9_MANES|nr:hypothetical protein MANES_01G044801v8 [Manihot esculenta]